VLCLRRGAELLIAPSAVTSVHSRVAGSAVGIETIAGGRVPPGSGAIDGPLLVATIPVTGVRPRSARSCRGKGRTMGCAARRSERCRRTLGCHGCRGTDAFALRRHVRRSRGIGSRKGYEFRGRPECSRPPHRFKSASPSTTIRVASVGDSNQLDIKNQHPSGSTGLAAVCQLLRYPEPALLTLNHQLQSLGPALDHAGQRKLDAFAASD
jgi:hypothetical protein